jgi:hypothetical protein
LINSRKLLAASFLGALTVASSAWSQLTPEANPKNTVSVGSLLVRSQDLTERIDRAKSQGKDTSTAEAERAEAEKAIQQGNDQAALRHFQAGERALGM